MSVIGIYLKSFVLFPHFTGHLSSNVSFVSCLLGAGSRQWGNAQEPHKVISGKRDYYICFLPCDHVGCWFMRAGIHLSWASTCWFLKPHQLVLTRLECVAGCVWTDTSQAVCILFLSVEAFWSLKPMSAGERKREMLNQNYEIGKAIIIMRK